MPISARFVVHSTIILLAVGFLTLAAIVGATVWLGERARIYANDAIAARGTRAAAVELRSALQGAESSQRGFLTSGNEIYLAPYDTAKLQAQRRLDQLKQALVGGVEFDALLQRLTDIVAEKLDEMDRTIALKRDRRDEDALALFRTNRGKALMDEANVFLSSIIRNADDRLTVGAAEQQQNATGLRWVSIVGGALIFLVVGGVTATILRYAKEIGETRDEVRLLNINLEQRVKDRTSELGRARDRAEVLLAEVNHRVANSLSLVAALVRLQSKQVADRAAKDALVEMEARIHAIASVHQQLYSAGDVTAVNLSDYLTSLLAQVEISTGRAEHAISLRKDVDSLRLKTDHSINLGVVVTEWITNAFKYAYPDKAGEVRIVLKRLDDARGELRVEDDGIGRGNDGAVKGTGLGTGIVKAMASAMGAEIHYEQRSPGTTARLVFPVETA